MPLILAGDVGGTKTWLGLFSSAEPRPVPCETARYATAEFDGLTAIVTTFLKRTSGPSRIAAACFGVAGPVQDNVSQLTHVPWLVDGAAMAKKLGIDRVELVNDLEAMAHAIPHLEPNELAVVQTGEPVENGNAALIAPGTGLGEACLHIVDGQMLPMPSEAGHTDFSARTPREFDLVSALKATQERVALEDVISGPGLVTLHAFTHKSVPCKRGIFPSAPNVTAAEITETAIKRTCPACVETVQWFVEILGAEAGDLALRTLPRAGLYMGGGIVPHILPFLRSSRFLDAFLGKGQMRTLLERLPISVILEPQVALIGAAVNARRLAPSRQ